MIQRTLTKSSNPSASEQNRTITSKSTALGMPRYSIRSHYGRTQKPEKEKKSISFKGPHDKEACNKTPQSLIQIPGINEKTEKNFKQSQSSLRDLPSFSQSSDNFLLASISSIDSDVDPIENLITISDSKTKKLFPGQKTPLKGDVFEKQKYDFIDNYKEKNTQSEKKVEMLTEAQLNAPVHFMLTETPTICLLNIHSQRYYSKNTELCQEISKRNASYKNLCENRSNDFLSEVGVETINVIRLDKEVEISPHSLMDENIQINSWEIDDTMEMFKLMEIEEKETNEQLLETKKETKIIDNEEDDFIAEITEIDTITESQEDATFKEKIFMSPNFIQSISKMEKAITQNEMIRHQLCYRGITDVEACIASNVLTKNEQDDQPQPQQSISKGSANMYPLWHFTCPETLNYPVNCLDWNHTYPDLLAAAYGSFEFGNVESGNIMLWTLVNPKYPSKIYKTRSGATCCSFCHERPYLIAAGMYNGAVAIYDIRDNSDRPAWESSHSTDKHMDVVWGMKWVEKGSERGRGQVLTTIGGDGYVKQWSTKKGLVPQNLMLLKRLTNANQRVNKTGFVLSRTASGLSFDFPSDDPTLYLAGDEDGVIHKCSVSYSEQVLDHYLGHTAPIYKIKHNPFSSKFFLSCSADWTCRIWNHDHQRSLLTFHNVSDYVMDIDWSPHCSTTFGSVTRDGRIDVWDLAVSTLIPQIQYKIPKCLTSIKFSQQCPVILAGTIDGDILVFRLQNLVDTSYLSTEKQIKRLSDSIISEMK